MNSGRRAVSGQACHSTAVAERRSPTPIVGLATRTWMVGAGASGSDGLDRHDGRRWRRVGLAGEPGGDAAGEQRDGDQDEARRRQGARPAHAVLEAAEIAVLDAGDHRLQGFGAEPVHAAPLVLAAVGLPAVVGGGGRGRRRLEFVAGRDLRLALTLGSNFFITPQHEILFQQLAHLAAPAGSADPIRNKP